MQWRRNVIVAVSQRCHGGTAALRRHRGSVAAEPQRRRSAATPFRRCDSRAAVTEGYGSTEGGTITVNNRVHAGVRVMLVESVDDGLSPDTRP